MIQELVYTSVPKGLAPDSQGFCTVACSNGMSPNLERELENLSGYRHPFLPGDERASLNPVSFFHLIRRIGGADMHILSRVGDCGVDYSQRTNKIGHHLALDERQLPSCGPASVLMQPNLFLTEWSGPPRYIDQSKQLANPTVAPQKCTAWEKQFGDAGWGGVVAEAIEAGRPISLVFEPGMQLLPLIAEALALLPPEKRWRTTFSTFFMKSQEPGRDKVQIKGILAGSEEMAYARLTPQTLFLDLRQRPNETPRGKYIELARGGTIRSAQPLQPTLPTLPDAALQKPTDHFAEQARSGKVPPEIPSGGLAVPVDNNEIFDLHDYAMNVPRGTQPMPGRGSFPGRPKKSPVPFWLILLLIPICIIGSIVLAVVLTQSRNSMEIGDEKKEIAQNTPNDVPAAEKDPADTESKDAAKEMPIAEAEMAERLKQAVEASENEERNTKQADLLKIVERISEFVQKIETHVKELGSEPPNDDLDQNKNSLNALKTELHNLVQTSLDGMSNDDLANKKAEWGDKLKNAEEQLGESKKVLNISQKARKQSDKQKLVLEKLPPCWDDLQFSQNTAKTLKDSKGLVEFKDRVKLTYLPFVKLGTETKQSIQFVNEGPCAIQFYYNVGQGFDGTTTRTKQVASIELKETGLVFKWEDFDRGSIDTAMRRDFHRILLAKLKIEIKDTDFSRAIALLTPTVFDLDRGGATLGEDFTLWDANQGTKSIEYIVNSQDNAYLLLTIPETVDATTCGFSLVKPLCFSKKDDSVGFTPNIQLAENLACHLAITVTDSAEWKLKAGLSSQDIAKTKIDIKSEEDNRKKAVQERNGLEKTKKEAEKKLQQKRQQIKVDQQQAKKTSEEQIGQLNCQIATLDQNIKAQETKIQQHATEKTRLEAYCKKEEGKMTKTPLNKAPFSIYLFNPTRADIQTGTINEMPKDSLLLLEVKPSSK